MLAQVKITDWNIKKCSLPDEIVLTIGDNVIVKVEDALEYGKVINLMDGSSVAEGAVKKIATDEDKESLPTQDEVSSALDVCRRKIEENRLDMKLVNASYSFDRSKITFAFISSARVDFRELLKALNYKFKIFIKLYQIGVRDRCKIVGDCGHCGRELCCKSFLNDFSSVSSNMAEMQQVSHRGSDRISGICGRLLCCLKFEQEEYERQSKKLPKIGDRIKVNNENLEVVSLNLLKESVFVKKENHKNASDLLEVDFKTKKPYVKV